MKVMVFVKATRDSEAGVMPTKELLTAMGAYNRALIEAGVMKDAAGLKPTRFAKRVRFSGEHRLVIDGPFTETKELVAGYWLWEVKSMEEAVEWLKKCPNPMLTDSDIDIRPLYTPQDLL
jgi:PhnB protein